RQLQVTALHRRTISDAVDHQLFLEAVLDARKNVLDLRAGHAPPGARLLAVVPRVHLDLAPFEADQHVVVHDEPELALRTLGSHYLAVDAGGYTLRNVDRFLADSGHLLRPCCSI